MAEFLSPGDICEGYQVSGPTVCVPEYLGVGEATVVYQGQGGEYPVVKCVDLVLGADPPAEIVGKIFGLRKGLECFSNGCFSSPVRLAGTQL